MKRLLCALAVALASFGGSAGATTVATGDYTITFFDNTGETWSGSFSAVAGTIQSFEVSLGTCSIALYCTWDFLQPGAVVNFDGTFIAAIAHSSNNPSINHWIDFPGSWGNRWASLNDFDTVIGRSGTYVVSRIPLPAAFPLFIAGFAALGLFSRNRKKPR